MHSRCSFAIATEVTVIHVVNGIEALLANATKVQAAFIGSEISNSFRIFHLCFSQEGCTFQSTTIPAFYNNAVVEMISHLEDDNRTIMSPESDRRHRRHAS
jgi:hypothetical protein